MSTPHAVLERGTQAGYPFALVQLDKDFTNGWGIATSQANGANLEITVAAGRTPPAGWAGNVRVALFGHTNPSYCLDQHLDKSSTDTLNRNGGSGLRRLHGFVGTASAAGTTTTLTDSAQPTSFPHWLVGFELYLESGPNAGQSRTIKSVSGKSITVATAFPSAIGSGNKYRAGHLSFPVVSVSGQNLRLATPFRALAGTGGALMALGSVLSISQGASKGGGLFYAHLKTASAHGLEAGDYVVILGTNIAAYNCARSTLVSGGGVTVHKVMSASVSNEADLEATYVGFATGGRWYGTCLTLLPATAAAATSEAVDEGRIDTPDYRRSDVRTLFVNKQKTLIGDLFTRHGARHIGMFDECAFRHATSAASTLATGGSYAGETTDEIIERVGQVGDWLQSTWSRKLTANVTAYLTKDSMSAAQRTNVINRWGGLMSEGACLLFDRSQYQMKGPDGYLDHITAMLTAGARYYYQPQDIDLPAKIASRDISSSGSNGNRVRLTTATDSGLFPTKDETDVGGHNHSGSLIGVYNHSIAALNGVHRVRSREAANSVTLETRYFSGTGSGGKLVCSHYAPPLKTLSISPITDGMLVTTEFPHNIPAATDEVTRVRIFGYTGLSDQLTYPVKRTSDTQFELSFSELSPKPTPPAQSTAGICFFCRADHWHWLGLSYLLWQSGKALEYSSGSLALPVNTPSAYLPSGLSADGAYTITSFGNEIDATHGTLPKLVLIDNTGGFTDAVLGEQVLFTSGTNLNVWRRIIARTATTLTVDNDFPNNILPGDKFAIGLTDLTDPAKLLQLTRSFNGGTRRVFVYPQKCAVTYTGF